MNVFQTATAGTSAIFSAEGIKANYDGSINVRVVEIKTDYEGLPVSIKSFPYRTALPVEIQNRRLSVEMDKTVDVNVKNSYIYTKNY